MCTLSLIIGKNNHAHPGDFRLGMNRDEQKSRTQALPPARFHTPNMSAIYPHEPRGGTWVGANKAGIALALLNWNIPHSASPHPRSRGTMIPALLQAASLREAQIILRYLELNNIAPFRLVGVFSQEQAVREWRWNGAALRARKLGWCSQHWFSSSLGDEPATANRRKVVNAAAQQPSAGSVAWLRRLHRAHGPEPGAFSVCVHRAAVSTVSYTEIACTAETLRCFYLPGSPCSPSGAAHTITLSRRLAPMSR